MSSGIGHALFSLKTYIGGAIAVATNNLLGVMPDFIDTTFLTNSVNIFGVGVPAFFIYLLFLGD